MATRTTLSLLTAVLALACTHPSVPLDPARSTRAGGSATSTVPLSASAPALASVRAPAASPGTASAHVEPVPLAGGGTRSVSGSKGIVTSADALATRAGVEVLESGGNAVDAAIATAAVLAVTHPSAGNLGGGGFALVRPPAGPTIALDFRETAPLSLTRADFDRMIADQGRGPVAVGIPGSVAGLLALHRRFGKLPLARSFEAAIRLARSGHPLAKGQAAVMKANWASLRLDRAARQVFGGKSGEPLSAGATLVQKDLALTLERVAALGEAGFYAGAVARAISVATARHVTEAELVSYRAVERVPIRAEYRGFVLETMPLPSTGGLLLAGELNALSALGAPAEPPESVGDAHLFVEVSRRAQAERRLSLLDPDALAEGDRRAREARLLDPALLLRVPVDRSRATPSAKVHPLYTEALRETEHTTHLSVIDRDGMAVSLTTTLSASFGAKLMASGTGVLLGNAVASFGSVGDNQPTPGRRTTSSMAPTLVLAGGAVVLVLGTPGGDTIPSTLVELVRRLVEHRLPLDEATDLPRLHHGFVPDGVRYEAARPPPKAVLDGLKALGHQLLPSWAAQGDANSIVLSGGLAFGYADPRETSGLALAAAR